MKPKDLDGERDDWMHMFDQYGMMKSHQINFILIEQRNGDIQEFDEEEMIQVQKHIIKYLNMISVPTLRQKQPLQEASAELFQKQPYSSNYENKCNYRNQNHITSYCSNILKWSEHKDKRLDPQNGLCLSQLVDKCFENNLIYIDDDYRVVVSESAKKDKSLYEQLKIYEGKKIFKPKNKNAQPKKEYLKIHRENN